MSEKYCDFCGDPLEKNATSRGDKVYCCEACAFEASRSIKCGGLADPPQPYTTSESDRKQNRASRLG